MLRVAAVHRDVPGEIRAPGTGLDLDPFDRQVGMRVQELRQHPLHLDAGCVSLELDARRAPTSHEVEDLALEFRVSGGGFEVREQLGHLGSGRGWRKNMATNVSKVKRQVML